MASSNRHWPSMFKSKPCNTHHHHQWQHDINSSLMSNGSHKSSHTSGSEERSPDPKPRWNPKPEQIRILEAIFNSGMVNPPRDEIRKIRAQLQVYGQVGDANVFYWFQNRKSRSKHKQRQLQSKAQSTQQINHPNKQPTTSTAVTPAPPSSSSSSSEKSSSNSADKTLSDCSKLLMDVSNSPTESVNQPAFPQFHNESFLPETFFFPVQQTPSGAITTSLMQGFCFPDISNITHVVDQAVVAPSPGLFLSDFQATMNHGLLHKKDDDEKTRLLEQFSYPLTTAPSNTPTIVPPTSISIAPTLNQVLQGGVESGDMCANNKSMVFINDVAFEVGMGPFNVREAFGDDAVLVHSSGHPVLTNHWGLTLQPLQHGAFYFLLRTLAPSHDFTVDLI